MKISYEWIRKYVPTKIRAKNLAEALTANGLEVNSMEARGEDFIFDIEVTPNRFDCLSHIGIAREISAITKKPLKMPTVNLGPYFAKGISAPKVVVENEQLCPRYTARVIIDVEVAPSPKWLIKIIESVGLRPVNNIVDITNFVLMETGQPLHAFDYDKLTGDKIIVRLAKQGEEIATIDGEKRKLKNTTLVIADSGKATAIAGIMGGVNTEVSSSTKRILLESAYFNAVSVRRSSRYLGLGSDSSYRFERGVDPAGVVSASDRAAALICKIAGGKTHNKIIDTDKKQQKTHTVTLRPERVNAVLGSKISSTNIKSILSSLEFKVQTQKNTLKVSVPSFREDVEREIDLIEEIARIHGYNNIPTILPRVVVTEEHPLQKRKSAISNLIRETLSSLGFYETLTYSLISKDDLEKLNAYEADVVSVQNPLSEQQAIMRSTLLAGMLKSINYNINMGNAGIRLFELSNIYFNRSEGPGEEESLVLGVCGSSVSDWKRPPEEMNIFYLKGILRTMFDKLGINVYFTESQHPAFEPGETMAILADNTMLGVVGMIKGEVLDKVDIKKKAYTAEINIQALSEGARLKKSFKSFSRYPKSERDISICVNNEFSFENINKTIKETASSIIKDIVLAEEYKGAQIPKGQRGLSFKITYQSKEGTLKEQDIEQAQERIRNKLTQDFNAKLR